MRRQLFIVMSALLLAGILLAAFPASGQPTASAAVTQAGSSCAPARPA